MKRLVYYPLRWIALRKMQRLCKLKRAIVLTYDDGPGRSLTRALLSLLNAYDAKATFFLLGHRVEMDPETVALTHDAGHELGVHTYSHGHAWELGADEAVLDIEAGYSVAAPWVNSDGLFRPPHGKLSYATWRMLHKRGARICWWTIDSGDTWDILPTLERCMESITRSGGGVVLMHDFDREQEREAFVLELTERILKLTRNEGYRVMTLSELLN